MSTVGGWLGRFGIPILLVVLVIGFSIAKPESFATWDNFRAILNNETAIVLLAFAGMIPLIVGEFDLSVAGILSVAQTLVVGLAAKQGLDPALTIPLALLAGLGLGLLNGIVVVKLRIPAFVATLASANVMLGLVLLYTKGNVIYEGVPESLTNLGRNSVFGIPLPVIYVLVVAAVLFLVLRFLPVGRRLYAVGGNRRAAELSGIRSDQFLIGSFAAAGVLAGLAGVVLGASLGSAQPASADSLLLPAYAAVFLGATTITLGRFNVIGTVFAVYVLSVAVSGMQQLGAASWVEPVFNGAALIIAMALSGYAGRLRARRARRRQLARLAEAEAEREGESAPVMESKA